MIHFLGPLWLLLALPLALVIWRNPGPRRSADLLRATVGLLFIAALARPYLERSAPGRHVMVLVDRSLSMPTGSDEKALETLRLIEAERKPGDQLGIMAFGAHPHLERLASESLKFAGFTSTVDANGTDLAAAIAAGADWIPEGSQGSLVVISDGEFTGRDPLPEAHRAAARGLRIDLLPQTHKPVADISVERFDLPDRVDAGEPFQFDAWVFSEETAPREVILRRNGRILSRRTQQLEPGLNRLIFRDIASTGGVASYSLDVIPPMGEPMDRRPENDHGLGAVRIMAPPAVLLLNEDGKPSTISETLRTAGIPVTVSSPEAMPMTRVGFTAYRAVILENVAADRIGYTGMQALADFVTERGGGLLMTGGRASFGIGGYHLSPIDKLLPVSMEMRKESRKLGVAIAMVLDRSGSMGMPVSPLHTKMDLANAGTAAAIEMLSEIDSVAVIAVDTQPHEIVELRPVKDPQAIIPLVRGIRSKGGGIYTYNGLLAGGMALEAANQRNRHIILFADAGDAEQPEGVPELLKRFNSLNITVSVIALGTETDSDASFLKRIAKDGGGEAYFTTQAKELPRLFAQDTMTIARSTFVEETTATQATLGLFAMGEFGLSGGADGELLGFPTVAGYNLTFARPEATLGAITEDDFQAPFFAIAQRGVGRVAAFTGQVGGTYGQAVTAWPSLGDFLVSTTRYLLGNAEPEDLFATTTLEGNEVLVRVEVAQEPGAAPPDTSVLNLHMTLGDGSSHELPLQSVAPGRFEARVPLDQSGIALGSVHLAENQVLNLPPVALPFSPEFKRVADPDAGRRTLDSLAKATGGAKLDNLAQTFAGPRQSNQWRVISPELLFAALLLLLFEIATRRLDLFAGINLPRRRSTAEAPQQTPQSAPSKPRATQSVPTEQAKEIVQDAPVKRPSDAPLTMAEALEQARKKAAKRLGR